MGWGGAVGQQKAQWDAGGKAVAAALQVDGRAALGGGSAPDGACAGVTQKGAATSVMDAQICVTTASRFAGLRHPKSTTITPADSGHEQGTTGGQVT